MSAAIPTREEVMQALFDLLKSSLDFKTASRRWKIWSDVPFSERPALFLKTTTEQVEKAVLGMPLKRTISAEIWVYDQCKDVNSIGDKKVNDILTALDPTDSGVLKPDVPTGQLTLGGKVRDCYISGDVLKEDGSLDGDIRVYIPLKILMP